MDIQEVNKRILELTERLVKNQKVRDKHRVRKISRELKSYIETEIKRLEETKALLLLQEKNEKAILLSWKEVNFEDGYITFLFERKIYKIASNLSKKSYNYIKDFLFRLNLEPIFITLQGDRIFKVKNNTEFIKCFEFFKLEHLINEIPKDYNEEVFKALIKYNGSKGNDPY